MNNEENSFISTTEAMQIASVSRTALIRWCEEFELGKKVAGRWRVSKKKLIEFLRGENPIEKRKKKRKQEK